MNIDSTYLIRLVYIQSLQVDEVFLSDLHTDICSQDILMEALTSLENSGLVTITDGTIVLTDLGRAQLKVVFTGGAYDILHAGHLKTLQEARAQGNVLVVVIARDFTVSKNKRKPIIDESDRLELVNAIKHVDLALLGDSDDHFKIVNRIKPDVIAIGADQKHQEEKIKAKLKEIGLAKTQLVRLESDYEGLSTTQLIEKIIKRFS